MSMLGSNGTQLALLLLCSQVRRADLTWGQEIYLGRYNSHGIYLRDKSEHTMPYLKPSHGS